jgi:hypothetical protein
MRIKLHKRIFVNFVLVIALFGVLGAAVSGFLINRATLNEAQRRVSLNLRSAWNILYSDPGQWMSFRFALPAKNPEGGDHGS